jgi:hypothetical protein
VQRKTTAPKRVQLALVVLVTIHEVAHSLERLKLTTRIREMRKTRGFNIGNVRRIGKIKRKRNLCRAKGWFIRFTRIIRVIRVMEDVPAPS